MAADTSVISQPSASRILQKFCQAFCNHYSDLIQWYNSDEELLQARRQYYQETRIKGLLGMIDGSMTPIKGVTGPDEPAYICRKGFAAINCQV